MKKTPLPLDEAARLAAVRSLRIVDGPAEERFDRVTRVAQRVFGVPIAMVTLVDEDREWLKSRQGLTAAESPRELSFSSHVLLSDGALVVPDARDDERFADHPWVGGPPYLRFYAGHPLKSPEGHSLGSLSIADVSPRDMSADDLRALRDLAGFVQDELQISRLTEDQRDVLTGGARLAVDPLTGLWTRAGIAEILTRELARAGDDRGVLSVLFVRVDGGPSMGPRDADFREAFRVELAQRLRSCVRYSDSIGCWDDGEFVVILPATGREGAVFTSTRIRTAVGERPFRFAEREVSATVSLGVGFSGGPGDESAERLIGRAGACAREAQNLGGNRVEVAG